MNIVRLYPYIEYGSLEVRVLEVSSSKSKSRNKELLEEHNILVTIQLNDYVTNYGNEIILKQGMPATVEIITSKKKLVERLFEKIKYISKK